MPFDPIAAGGVPFDPVAAGGVPVGSGPSAPGANASGTPGIAVGTPPGFDQAINAQATQQQAMASRSQTYANDMFPLFKAQQQLAVAPTGKGSEAGYDMGSLLGTVSPNLQKVGAFISTLGGLVGGGIMTPEQTAAYAEANKYLTQASLGVAGATRSNEGGQTASAASPSVNIPKPAAQAVLQGMIGLRRMEQDQTLQWQKSGHPVANLNKFVTGFQTNADPRVYVWDQMTPAQRQSIYKSMTPPQQQAFSARVTQADNDGIYNNFGISAPAGAAQ
jgi:hypothetical protein